MAPFPAGTIVLDFESSGLDEASYPISLGMSVLGEVGNWTEFYTLIQPHASWTYWSATSQDIHKLHRHEIERYGLPIPEVAKTISRWAPRPSPVFVTSGWDDFWMRRLFQFSGEPWPVIADFETKVMETLGDDERYWEIADQVSRSHPHTHHALDDARQMAAIISSVNASLTLKMDEVQQ